MNIFKILASGDGNLKEPNISAFLAYLINPNEDHGLGNKFIKGIWSLIHEKGEQFPKGKVDVKLEPPLHSKEKRNFCDIKIAFYKEDNSILSMPSKVIFIENKIRESLSKPQLKDQVAGIEDFLDNYLSKSFNNYLIFLTPDGDKYKKVIEVPLNSKNLFIKHLLWNFKDKPSEPSIINLLKDCQKNANFKTKNLLKSLIEFIEEDFKAFNFKKNAAKNKKNLIKDNIEFESDFLPSFCETRTLETYKNLSIYVEKLLKNKPTKKCYISNNRMGIIAYPRTVKGSRYFIRFDVTPYKIKLILSNPADNIFQRIKSIPAKTKMQPGKNRNFVIEFSSFQINDTTLPILKQSIAETIKFNLDNHATRQ